MIKYNIHTKFYKDDLSLIYLKGLKMLKNYGIDLRIEHKIRITPGGHSNVVKIIDFIDTLITNVLHDKRPPQYPYSVNLLKEIKSVLLD